MRDQIVSTLCAIALTATFMVSTDAVAAKGGNGKGGAGSPGGGSGSPGGSPAVIEGISPDAISNAVSLHWVVPATPADGADIHHYDVRFSTTPLDAANLESDGTLAERSDVYLANAPGKDEYFTVRELDAGTLYHFGVRAVSDGGTMSEPAFVSISTSGTPGDPGLWAVENVADVDAEGENLCCAHSSVQFDSSGDPTIVWRRKRPDEIQFAYRVGDDNWVTEIAFAGSNCSGCTMWDIMGFSYVPGAAPDVPAVMFSHIVPKLNSRNRNEREEQVVYAWRRFPNEWVAEEVVRGNQNENDGIYGYDGRFAMDHFYDSDSDSWIATAAYIQTRLYNDPNTIVRLVFSDRIETPGQVAQWNPTSIFECDDADAHMMAVKLRRGADGSLHAMVQMVNGGDTWVTLLHRPVDGDPVQYWQSDLFYGMAFNVDSQGNYYVAGRVGYDDGGPAITESPYFRSIPKSAVCTPPTANQAGVELLDEPGVRDYFLNGQEGEVIGTLGGEVGSVELTGDDGFNPPAVHVFELVAQGNFELAERRVLSRCPSVGGWNMEGVDRPHDNEGWRTVAVSDTGIAWAYTYGTAFGGHYDVLPPDRMMIAERASNACQP